MADPERSHAEEPASSNLSFSQILLGPLQMPMVLVDVVAFAGLVGAALAAPIAVIAGLGVLTIVLGVVARRIQVASESGAPLVNQFVLARVVLAGLVAILAAGADMAWPFWLFLVATGLATIGQSVAAAIMKYATPYAANIPGIRTRNQPRVASWPMLAFSTAAIAAGFLAVTIPAVTTLSVTTTHWIIAVQGVLAALAVAWLIAVCADAASRTLARQRFSRKLPALLDDIQPTFLLHWDAPPGTGYQVGMWLPELERIGEPYFVLVRNPQCFSEALRLTGRPVILLRYLEDLDACIVASLKAAFYVNNGIRNAHLVRLNQLQHVQLNHGESDKTPSFNPVFRMYDFDFVAGQAAIDRFAANGVAMPPEIFRIVGRPQVRDIAVASAPISTLAQPTVLYAPTWAGFNDDSRYSSLPYAEAIVQGLLDRGCRVVFRPHPYSYRTGHLAGKCRRVKDLLAADTDRTGTAHRYGPDAEKTMSIVDCFNESDALISDVSSVVADFLYSEKPLAMVAVSETVEEFREQYPIGRAAYMLEVRGAAVADIDGCLDAMLTDTELAEARRDMKRYYLGDIAPEEYADRFVLEARAVMAGTAAEGLAEG